jgi:hypothetical protein
VLDFTFPIHNLELTHTDLFSFGGRWKCKCRRCGDTGEMEMEMEKKEEDGVIQEEGGRERWREETRVFLIITSSIHESVEKLCRAPELRTSENLYI